FLNFIDCNNKNTHTESTKRLLNALDTFAAEKEFSTAEKIKKREEIYEYCKRCSKDRKEVLLENISALFYPEDVGLFKDFASAEEYKVSSVISVDNAIMRSLKYVKYRSEEFSIEFDEELVVNKKISLDARNRILIKEPPKYLIEKIKDIQGDAG